MPLFAHHMAVEFLGHEYSPHGTFQHVCVFLAIGTIAATSALGTGVLLSRALAWWRSRRGS
jgi:hypothetical protein